MKPKYLEIEALFGKKSPVRIQLGKKVQIIYGVNGSGKTTVLKLLHAILSGSLYEIRNIAFGKITLTMENNKKVIVLRKENKRPSKNRVGLKPYTIEIGLKGSGNKWDHQPKVSNNVEFSENLSMEKIEHENPELLRLGPYDWMDKITGDYLTQKDVIDNYSNLQPSTGKDWYRKLIDDFPVKFIQTQRLMTLKANASKSYSRREIRYEDTVIEYSEKLRKLIRDQLGESMQMAQYLDSTYPRRLLQDQELNRFSDEKLKDLLVDTDRLEEKLRAVDFLSKGDNFKIPLESISNENRRAIGLYLSDTIKKYEAIEPFADKLLLFLEIVNGKFQPRKTVGISGRDGIRIDIPGGHTIHPKLLSSGEQHEIVLLFDLIFFSKPGTLVLIDEPEISLHIDWQKKFLSDIEAIEAATGLKFMLATHSPAIIGNRIDICEEI